MKEREAAAPPASEAPVWVRWSAAGHPRSEGDVSGDGVVVRADEETFLVVVADGLGHGESAHAASSAAMRPFQDEDALRAPLEQLVKRAHEAAVQTRGAVLSVVRIMRAPLSVESVAVGNVAGVLRSGEALRERVFLAGGVVGFRIPKLRTFSARVQEPLVIALATDGVDERFGSDPLLDGPFDVERTAAMLLERHSAENDDALLFVARVKANAA